mmetsp:Transcript_74411/g.174596  ORF Transcript_74411/g.174596 Transcript_74411/m.174596 type:complete len:262 (-) Transcript_74411:32-817(-)
MGVFDREGDEVTFVYSRTFIDEVPMMVKPGSIRRSVSQPPPMTPLQTASDAIIEEESLRGYVQSLGTSSMHRFADVGTGTAPHDGEEAVVEKAGDPAVFVAAASCGSRGHPDLCKRACIYFVSGNCTAGAQCNFCHMPHADSPQTLEKQFRTKFNLMGKREALLLLEKTLTKKAATNGFLQLAKDILDLVATEAMEHDALAEAAFDPIQRRFERVLVRMPFRQLALLTVSKANRDEFREPMVTCIEKLADDLQAKRNLELM